MHPLAVTRADGVTPSSVELAFDQLLLPASVTRQTFILTDLQGNDLTPTVSYDPVARVVSLTPLAPLTAGQTYRLTILTPQSATDPNGLRSVGGTTLSSSTSASITFTATSGSQADPLFPHSVDFCVDILQTFQGSCGTSSCHGGSLPAAGLALDSIAAILATAIGRTASGANTGPTASPPRPPGTIFGIDMPIVDPGPGAPASGNPADSWLVYKLLLAEPSPCPTTEGDGGDCDASAPVTAPPAYDVAWQPLSDDARATLANLVQGHAMPYLLLGTESFVPPQGTLSVPQLERVSFWIAEGAPVPASCP